MIIQGLAQSKFVLTKIYNNAVIHIIHVAHNQNCIVK